MLPCENEWRIRERKDVMGGFSTLYIGVSGLQSSHNAINTTTHNLANVNTPGYVRQQVVFADRKYETLKVGPVYYNQAGRGVSVLDIRHIRDSLLDKAYRQESGREAFYESQAQVIEEIEGYFGELEGEKFQDYLEDLWSAIQEVSKNPLATETRAALVQSAVSFVSKANLIYSDLRTYQKTLNEKVKKSVIRINEIGEEIHALNGMISKIEGGGLESANDYRDQRDSLLDELSGLINISYRELTNGVVTIKAEGVDFVIENGYHEMGIINPDGDADPELVVPVWNYLNEKEVFNITAPVSTVRDNDIGSLKAYILARGSAKADYTDIPNPADYVGGKDSAEYIRKINSGDYFAVRDKDGNPLFANNAAIRAEEKKIGKKAIDWQDYTITGTQKNSQAYEDAMDYYKDYVEPSSIMTVMAEFDQLINKIVEGINEVLSPTIKLAQDTTYAIAYDEKGNIINNLKLDMGTRVMDVKNAAYGKDKDMTQGTELFSRNHTKRYIEYTVYKDATGYVPKGTAGAVEEKIYVYNYKSVFELESLYSLTNIEVNPDVLGNNQLLPLSTIDGGEDRERADKINELWKEEDLKLLPEYSSNKNFMNYYTEFIGQMAEAGKLYNNMIVQQEELTYAVDKSRRQIMDVSSDEELQNLIKYQAAYNASSRFITVVDQMLELIVTQL